MAIPLPYPYPDPITGEWDPFAMIRNLRAISQEQFSIQPVNRGGTGLTVYATGDILYASDSTTLARRAIGSAGTLLNVSGGVPQWTDAPSVASLTASSFVAVGSSPASAGHIRIPDGGVLQAPTGMVGIKNTGTIADTGTFNLTLAEASGMLGFIYVVSNQATEHALYILRGTGNATTEVSDPSGTFSVTAGTATSTNIYWSAGNSRYELENNRGGNRQYTIFYFLNAS